MTISQYQRLDELEQLEAFWNGTLIGERHEDDYLIQCRQVHSFYVEYRIKESRYVSWSAFTNPQLLNLK